MHPNERFRIQAHVSPTLGQALQRAADRRGASLNNEVRLRLGMSLLNTSDQDLLIENVARAIGQGEVTDQSIHYARVALSLAGNVPHAKGSE